MSSAILYLAIVAIWAGVLVPRWLRREPHRDTSSRSRSRRAGMADPLPTADALATSDLQLASGLQPMSGGLATSVALTAGGADPRLVGSGAQSSAAEAALPHRDAAANRSGPARDADAVRRSAGVRHADAAAQRSDATQRSDTTGRSGAADRRARVVNARRRLLAMLGVLAVVAAAAAAAHLAAWWVAVPPTGMLVGYLTLLREAARADAELNQASSATRHSGQASSATRHAGRDRRETRRTAPAANVAGTAAEPGISTETAGTAQILDITERVYDQYADAKLRAVGD